MSNIRRMGYLLMLLVGAALLTAMVWRPVPPPPFVGVPSQDVPRQVAGLSASADRTIDADTLNALPGAKIVSRQYVGGSGAVDFMLLGGTSRESLHDPRACLTGAGLELADDHTERLPGTTTDVHACRVIGMPGTPGFDALYLYVVGGRRISSVGEIRKEMLWNAVIGRQNEPVYLLRFMQPLTGNPQTEAAAHDQLMAFAAQMWTDLQPRLEKA